MGGDSNSTREQFISPSEPSVVYLIIFTLNTEVYRPRSGDFSSAGLTMPPPLAITHPPHPLPCRASKRALAWPQNGRIPHILSNWVAAFRAAHRMWETGDKRLPFTTLPLFPPTHLLSSSLLLLLLLLSPPSFSRAVY